VKDTGDGDPLRVALYLRVSTDEQAKSGYSIADQRRTLREHAASKDWTVMEEIEDDGYSGASPDRPGIRRVYELAEAMEIDAVVATKRDRFFRSMLYRLEMDRDMKDHGVTLVSLTDTGNMIGDSVLDSFAEYEHRVIRERTASGKLQKARAGKVVGGHERAFGYSWKKDQDGRTVGYEVDEGEMPTVRRILQEAAPGAGIKTITDRLNAERVPTPRGGPMWNRPSVRDLIESNLYKPHTVDDLRESGVSEEVLKNLDAGSVYGLYTYKGIPVPIPDAGIPLSIVLEARREVASNVLPSKNGKRFWELSGGILFCSECGRRMQAHTVDTKRGYYVYYRCQAISSGKSDRCPARRQIRADRVEAEVWDAVRDLVSAQDVLLRRVRESFDAKRRELSRLNVDATKVRRNLSRVEVTRANYQRAFAADAMSLADLKARTAELDSERDVVRDQLKRAGSREAELEKLGRAQSALEQRIQEGYDDLDSKTPEERREIYKDLNLRVAVGLDKVPHISGVFPIRDGDLTGWNVRTPEGRGYVITTAEGSSDGSGRHAVYIKDSDGHYVGKEVTSSGPGPTSGAGRPSPGACPCVPTCGTGLSGRRPGRPSGRTRRRGSPRPPRRRGRRGRRGA